MIQGNEAKLIKIIDKFDDITERIFDDNTKSLLEYVIEYAKNTYNKSISQENYFKILDLVLENGKINKKDKNIFVKIINVMIKLVKDVNFYVWLKVTEKLLDYYNENKLCSITRYETYDITNIVCKKFDNKYSVIIDNVLKLLFKNNKNIDSLLESTINNYYVTKKLLENGANPNIIYFGILLKNINNKKTFNLLLEYGADPTLYPEYNYNRIDINSEILENILSLIKHNFCPSNHFIEKILRYMSNNDQLSKNKEILSEIFKLIDLNQTGYETPLMKYTKYKRYDIIEFLLKHGADPNVKSGCIYEYPLNVENIGIDIIRLLLEYGAGQNIENTL